MGSSDAEPASCDGIQLPPAGLGAGLSRLCCEGGRPLSRLRGSLDAPEGLYPPPFVVRRTPHPRLVTSPERKGFVVGVGRWTHSRFHAFH